ncbi:MAG TPA: hypothetical protein VN641_06475 [Urbifossiella sp.]|nr:hypothetical protein [Urbifossiella sp.]
MSDDEIKKRFVSEIEQRGYDDKFIDKNEEREILQIAIQLGVRIDNAKVALVQVCEEKGFIVESAIARQIRKEVDSTSGSGGKVDRRGFDAILANARLAIQGKKNDRDLQAMIVDAIEDAGAARVKTGWFSNWFANLKRDLGR